MLHKKMDGVVKSCIVLVVLLSSSLAFAASVVRGPYLQSASSDSITVRWRTDTATDSRVQYGASASSLTSTASSATSTKEHIVKLTGLSPNTKYFYNVGASGAVQAGDATYYFKTSPTAGTAEPARIWVIGDAGTGSSGQAAVYKAYRNYTGSTYTDFWLMLGDNAYNSGTDAEYQTNMFNVYPEMMRQSPLWATIGNHDGTSADSATQSGPYYDIHTFPKNAEAGGVASGTEAYYSFNYGNIHVIVLDSNETSRATNGAMMNWMKADLANVTATWLIAIWHHPPYTKGSHNSDTETNLIEMRKNFLPILENYGVDLVLTGHSHSYERSKFIDGHYGVSSTYSSSFEVNGGSGRVDGTGAYTKTASLPHSGAVYSVVGASGQVSGGTLNHPAMFLSLNELGSMVIDVSNQTMDIKYLNNNGAVRDYFTISKNTTPPTTPAAPGALTATAASSSAINLAWTDNANNETGFDVERSSDNVNWAALSSVGSNVQAYASTGLAASTTYYYRVRAKNSAGPSAYSNVANATTLGAGSTTVTVDLRDGLNGYAGTQDTYVASGASGSNFGSASAVMADGSDGSRGELVSLLKWGVTGIPTSATVKSVRVGLQAFNPSAGTYRLYARNAAWTESTATWSNANIAGAQGTEIGNFVPSANGAHTITLNAAGIAMVQGWLNGSVANHGLTVRSSSSDGVDLRSSEYGTVSQRPTLSITYQN
ncbi:DNRLRE domain-containing protein [Massilia sp. CF038]|uniref:DNRLRE domain-containing protein n=1 Tax=Massilia sp. CF038 TaxID=1881045 RepID=UPI0009108AF4|nr:DNRLRE domain-containing protein [Massilia sp. CF038]SHH67224.1 Fibronectin type III domain-containing protein [Massilia sp. CF038]